MDTNDFYSPARVRERLNSASFHVSTNWLPLNPAVIDDISHKLDSDYYLERRDELIDDFRSDLALFAYCIKEFSIHSGGKVSSVYELIKQCEFKRLKDIIAKARKTSLGHQLAQSGESQIQQLNANITSAAITETLAAAGDSDAELAFITAMFRQLGLTFIAWNYPHLFESSLRSTSGEEEFLEHLNRSMGFSPAMLGLRLAKEWQMPSGVIRVLDAGLNDEEENITGLDQASELILKLCKIGETLASLNNSNYPAPSQQRWNMARNEVLRQLGSKGFKALEENISKLSRHYASVFPRHMESSLSSRLADLSKHASEASLFQSNAYVKFIDQQAQDEMRDFYQTITPEGLTKDSISFLSSRLIPALGFSSGALFLFDPSANTLVPRLSFGRAKPTDYPSVKIHNDYTHNHPVARAFLSTGPIAYKEVLHEREEILSLCGVIGSIQRTGVLYLDTTAALRKNDKLNPSLCFRCLLRAIEDCLGLR